LVYSGIIDSIRNPVPLLEALKAEFSEKMEEVNMTFVGNVSESVREFVLSDSWLAARIHFAGYVPHREVFRFYELADALILILTDTKNAQGNIPGKLFEYLATGIPVLALGDPKGDSAAILENSGSGCVIAHSDAEGIKKRLRAVFESEKREAELGNLEMYSRKNLSFQLAKILNENSIS